MARYTQRYKLRRLGIGDVVFVRGGELVTASLDKVSGTYTAQLVYSTVLSPNPRVDSDWISLSSLDTLDVADTSLPAAATAVATRVTALPSVVSRSPAVMTIASSSLLGLHQRQRHASGRQDDFGAEPAIAGYAGLVMDDAPLVYYRMHEAGGLIAIDEMGLQDGDYNAGGQTFRVDGPGTGGGGPDFAVDYDNAGTDRMQATNVALDGIGSAEFTFEGWFKADAGATQIAMMEKTSASVWNSLSITAGSGGKPVFQVLNVSNPVVTGTTVVNGGTEWFHIVAMRTLAAGVHGADGLRIYVNAGTAEDTDTVPIGSFDSSNSHAIEIGDRTIGSGAGPFKGGICHCAMYDYALSDAQIQAHFDAMT